MASSQNINLFDFAILIVNKRQLTGTSLLPFFSWEAHLSAMKKFISKYNKI